MLTPLLATAILLTNAVALQPLTPGDILISSQNTVAEYTRTGNFVQSIAVPYPGTDSYPNVHDVVIDDSGNIDVFNGTFDPYLSTYDFSQGTWSHRTYDGWSLVNNASYGGLATEGHYVYVPDMSTSGGTLTGIVRFDLAAGTATSTAMNIAPIDLNIGLNGLLYAMYPGGAPSGRYVNVYDPETLDFQKTINVTSVAGADGLRGVAVDSDGTLFVVAWDETVYHLSEDGSTILGSLALSANDTFDIDIAADGSILVGSRFGQVTLTDRTLSTAEVLSVGNSNVSACFIVPEPSSLSLVFCAAASVAFGMLIRSSKRTRTTT
jgi:hypothetical protein